MSSYIHRLLHWLTEDDVARTNAAQASVRLQHRRHDIDDANTYLVQHRIEDEQPPGDAAPTDSDSTASTLRRR